MPLQTVLLSPKAGKIDYVMYLYIAKTNTQQPPGSNRGMEITCATNARADLILISAAVGETKIRQAMYIRQNRPRSDELRAVQYLWYRVSRCGKCIPKPSPASCHCGLICIRPCMPGIQRVRI